MSGCKGPVVWRSRAALKPQRAFSWLLWTLLVVGSDVEIPCYCSFQVSGFWILYLLFWRDITFKKEVQGLLPPNSSSDKQLNFYLSTKFHVKLCVSVTFCTAPHVQLTEVFKILDTSRASCKDSVVISGNVSHGARIKFNLKRLCSKTNLRLDQIVTAPNSSTRFLRAVWWSAVVEWGEKLRREVVIHFLGINRFVRCFEFEL